VLNRPLSDDNDRVRTLYGRGRELAVLREFVGTASSGTGGVVRIEGPVGIGKSTLLGETARLAQEHGLHVAVGTADELDQVTPWGPLVRALATAEPPLLGRADLDSLRGAPDQRAGAVEVLRGALEQASPRCGVLVAIDDLQWADAATLHALGALTEPVPEPAVRLPARPGTAGRREIRGPRRR
jgi:hypothetical protein